MKPTLKYGNARIASKKVVRAFPYLPIGSDDYMWTPWFGGVASNLGRGRKDVMIKDNPLSDFTSK